VARDLSCQSGKPAYKTKREAEIAHGARAKRCDRCRWWHPTGVKGWKTRSK